ncbi:hypothetical protein Goshw_029316, partial [Gossypium schwendimanii]|nr:hypothetical protein [Gossypium schwendimanii]
FAYSGINSNLVTYLTGPLGQSTATATVNVNAWSGTAALLPLLGAFIVDSFLGRYRTIVVASLIYILHLDKVDINHVSKLLVQISSMYRTQRSSKPRDNLSWVLGFGILCIIMVVALIVFLCGTTTYRYSVKRFLNKALLAPDDSKEHGKVCSIEEVEEAKAVLRLVSIWATCLVYAVVLTQSSTFFTKQGATMDRSITVSVKIPAASLQSFISLTIVLSIPIYDCIFVPLARTWTRKSTGMTMLQRIRTGMFLSSISIILAALVEMKRLKTIQEYGLVDKLEVTVPMSVWWLVPQYVVIGLSKMLTMVGLQEFFYDQVPNELRSIGLALHLSIFGVGSFLSGFLISTIDKATGGNGG